MTKVKVVVILVLLVGALYLLVSGRALEGFLAMMGLTGLGGLVAGKNPTLEKEYKDKEKELVEVQKKLDTVEVEDKTKEEEVEYWKKQ